MPNQIARARLYPKVFKTSEEQLIFDLNPSRVVRSKVPNYADLPIAGADYGPNGSPFPPFQWVSNRAEEIRIEFLLETLDKQELITERYLKLLDDFMRVDITKGEPRDLIFVMGSRSDVVRIFEKQVEEKLYFDDLTIKQAMVSLTMRTTGGRSVQYFGGQGG